MQPPHGPNARSRPGHPGTAGCAPVARQSAPRASGSERSSAATGRAGSPASAAARNRVKAGKARRRAEGEGFEPSGPGEPAQRFSRPDRFLSDSPALRSGRSWRAHRRHRRVRCPQVGDGRDSVGPPRPTTFTGIAQVDGFFWIGTPDARATPAAPGRLPPAPGGPSTRSAWRSAPRTDPLRPAARPPGRPDGRTAGTVARFHARSRAHGGLGDAPVRDRPDPR